MPELYLNGTHLHYEDDGDPQAPALLLINSLGTDCTMWMPQIPAFARSLRVVRFDTRGQGASEVTPGPYTIAQLAADVIGILDTLKLAHTSVCGLSMGGLIAQHLAIHAPQRVDRLILCCTAARIGTPESWNSRMAGVEADGGLAALVPAILERWYTAGFRARSSGEVERTASMLRAIDAQGYLANCAAIRDANYLSQLALIQAPTLVVCGSADTVTPPDDAAVLAQGIRRAVQVTLDAAHLANVEQPHAFNTAVLSFLQGKEPRTMDEQERYRQGLQVRRAVLGEEHVERSLSRLTGFNEDFHNFITRYAWGEVWTRPQLPRHTRSLLTLAMMVALNREQEFKLHIAAAFRNGVTRDQIKEVLLQTAIYCGLPAANSAFHWAEAAFAALDAEQAAVHNSTQETEEK